MITLQKHRTRQREYRGPEPGSVAILARNPGRSSDLNIQNMKKEADYRARCEEESRIIREQEIRNDWEKESTNKMLKAATQRKFEAVRTELNNGIEIRRDKLRQLLREDANEYEIAHESSHETVLERQAKLRERARKLKEEKALDHDMIAKMKYEQLWRDQCEELRTVISKRTANEIKNDNLEIIRQKEEYNTNIKRYEDEYFAQLWYDDIKKKEEREKRDEDRVIERNNEMTRILLEQKALVEEKRQKEKELKDEEKRLRLEMLQLKKEEMENNHEAKLKHQKLIRDGYDENLRQKLKRINRERQDEIALDTLLLERLLADSESESSTAFEKKKKLKEDSKRYREYLKMLKLQEEAREKELDDIMNEEVRKQWQKRLDQWDREAVERKRLLQEVIAIRQQQVQDKITKNQEEQRINMIEREKFAAQIEQFRQEDLQKRQNIIEKDRAYRQDLKGQIQYNREQQEKLELELEHEKEMMRLEEEQFRAKIDATIAQDWVDPHAHPWRKHQAMMAASANATCE